MSDVLRINASTRSDRNLIIARAKEAILQSGGWVLDFKLFSNISICINFEIVTANIEELRAALNQLDLRLSKQSHEALESFKDEQKEGDIKGALQITFIHDEPDLRRDVPAIPG
ncbi:MAG TPA: hypothetical protein VLR90_13915 [Blastocatellia bacterium]|nr:hypothetical protein [Blastocatellia bacterium]